jgi:hypothetical protein
MGMRFEMKHGARAAFLGCILAACQTLKAEAQAARAPAAAATEGAVEFKVTTVSAGGGFAPRHVLAIWVTDGQGSFVKTIEADGRRYGKHLRMWIAAAGGSGSDAVTGATVRAHKAHEVTWDCRDSEGKLAPDGEYEIRVEFTEKNGAGPATPKGYLRFRKGRQAVAMTPKDLANFRSMSLAYTPGMAAPAPAAAPVSRP